MTRRSLKSTPKALDNKAQGREQSERTLGWPSNNSPNPNGVGQPPRGDDTTATELWYPFGVHLVVFRCQPRVRSLRSRPWALLSHPFGVKAKSFVPNSHSLVSLALALALVFGAIPAFAGSPSKRDPAHPLSEKQRAEITKRFAAVVAEQTKAIAAKPTRVDAYSRRGDAYLFLGRFKKAVADYDKMVQLDPKRDASHWRRGIAYFYAGDYKKAARQFEVYNTVDMVDRENGIWRFFSQAKAYGVEKARKNLLKYKKTDREPFGDVYRLFAKKIAPEQIIKNIESAKIGKDDRNKRLFYAHLYIGLNEALAGNKKTARRHLHKAVANPWGQSAGFGPNYMWHVGRLHYELLK
jgi:lipoprotein NlpI